MNFEGSRLQVLHPAEDHAENANDETSVEQHHAIERRPEDVESDIFERRNFDIGLTRGGICDGEKKENESEKPTPKP